MNLPDIANLEDLLSDLLDNNKNHVNIERKRLTSLGENYGSLIIAIKVTTQEENEEETVYHLVAKLAPSSDFFKQFMNISYTFRNEYAFYNTILPCLCQFQKEQGFSKSLDFFPKFFGGRISMDTTKKEADEDAVILLENLKNDGFVAVDRESGFDLTTSKLILEKLAELHGTALALKILKPELFEEILMPFFDEHQTFKVDEEIITWEKIIEASIQLVKEDELCSLYMDRIKETLGVCCERFRMPKNSPIFRKGIFTTFVHGDLWINNIMVKSYNNKIIDVKLLDFQLFEYNSITKDVLFFIFSSVQMGVLKNYVNDLINFYFNQLIKNLEELHCDVEKFSFNDFMEEMKQTANKLEYPRILMVLHLIYRNEHKEFDIETFDKDKFNEQMYIPEEAKKRAALITREFIQRGWI